MNRREFLELTAAGTAAISLGALPPLYAGKDIRDWNPDAPFMKIGQELVVQPVLMYTVSTPRKQSSYKSWGGIQDDAAAKEENKRISIELNALAIVSDFPLVFLPVQNVKTIEAAAVIHKQHFDALIVYAARGGGDLLRACISKEKNTLLFVRHKSGPVYYWYEALSVRYLQTDNQSREQAAAEGKFAGVHDVVVDDMAELQGKLRALFGLKNFLNTKIIALGGPMGKYSQQAPEIAQTQYNWEIVTVSYDELSKRIQSARSDQRLIKKSKEWSQKYLSIPGTTLKTERQFIDNCFILYWIFRDLMDEHQTPVFTIKDCMGIVMPISETTACLTLGLLNDEGYMAFCESDFVIIPPGVLLRYISGKPVFLHNSTFPHKGEVTCAHCIGPRRMDGHKYEPAEIMTHYESEYGAAPKVEIPVGQELTFLDPEYSSGRWLGFKGRVKRNPYYEICRSQQDVEIIGNWRKLKNEVRDSHWVAAYGDHLDACGYAAGKLGLEWENISQT
jgi:hypothetical protein